jgi:prolipoprotein diacylglyceryltransferase
MMELLLGLVVLLGFIFWLWMLVDCATKESNDGNTKIVWTIIIVFTNIVGAAIYWLVRRPQRYRELHR